MSKLPVSNWHASHLNTHGTATVFSQHLSEKLKEAKFSKKIDEAPNPQHGQSFYLCNSISII